MFLLKKLNKIGRKNIKVFIKALIPGVLWIVFAFLFWLHSIGNPYNEFMLIISQTQTTTGNLIDTIEHESEDDRGRVTVYDEGIYTFYVPNKGEFKTSSEAPLGELKQKQEVEYLPNNPAVCRIKGDGPQSIVALLFRKVGIGSIFLILLLTPGVVMLKNGIRDIREVRANQT